MATIGQWVSGARPRTLPAAIAPVAAGTGAAAAADAVDLLRAGLALLVALALQVGVNYANDYSDGVRGTDAERVGPVRLVGQGLAPASQVKVAALGSLALAGVIGLFLVALTGQWWLLLVGAASIVAAWLYTGGPRPYGYAGYGELFVFVFFGPVAVIGTAYVQTLQITSLAVLASLPMGALAAAILVANNLRDIPTDELTGKHTLAVMLGGQRTRVMFAVLTLGAFVPVLAMAAQAPGALAGLAGLVPAIRAVRLTLSGATGPALITVLVVTSSALLLTGLGIGLGLALID